MRLDGHRIHEGEIILPERDRQATSCMPTPADALLQKPETQGAYMQAGPSPAMPPPVPSALRDRESLGFLSGKSGMPRQAETEKAGPGFYLAGAAIVAACFWFSGGHVLFRPSTLAAVPAGPELKIDGFQSRILRVAGVDTLLVTGSVVNQGTAATASTPVVIAVTGTDGSRLSYQFGQSGRLLAAGERTEFSMRLDAPPSGVKTVSARLAGE